MNHRHPHILQRDRAALIIIDMQEKLAKAIPDFEHIEKQVEVLAEGCQLLSVPIFYTEQYPQGLGRTTPPIKKHLSTLAAIEKTSFSSANEQFVASLQKLGVNQLVLAGIEAHVCVIQSALDFQYFGFQVHVTGDASSSRQPQNRDLAFERMRYHGVNVTTVESVLFEMLQFSGMEEFRSISRLLK